jgi:regulatory protein SWI5
MHIAISACIHSLIQSSFESASSPFAEDTQVTNTTFTSTSSFPSDIASMNILQQLSQVSHTSSHTPPQSPADVRPHSSGSTINNSSAPVRSSPLKGSSSPSRSSIQSNPLSTPPTSPFEPKDELDELFNDMRDSNYSHFELEMKALGEPEFNTLDAYLDFDM